MSLSTRSLGKEKEKAILVGVAIGDISNQEAMSHLGELSRLAETAGAEVIELVMQRRPSFDPSTLIGRGKLREIETMVKLHCVQLVIFDDELSGSQIRKLESILDGVKVLDRSGLILDIFARHATTSESKLQVELAQLQYMLPRLTRQWTHLSRQVGGIGTRGPGETQLEVDRRDTRRRISELGDKLNKLEKIRINQHNRRIPTFHAALVGYTKAGKSTLMNAVTKATVLAADKLFATLDPTTRKLWLGPRRPAVLSDTVGFIRKLPQGLVSSFKSTLSVVCQATLILHVIDASAEDFEEQMAVTASVLQDLGTDHIDRLVVFNKIDLLEPERLEFLHIHYPSAIFVSAENKIGLEDFKSALARNYATHNFHLAETGDHLEDETEQTRWG